MGPDVSFIQLRLTLRAVFPPPPLPHPPDLP